MRKVKFTNGEYYHVYNRGVDKRDIFLDEGDYRRFSRSMIEFNRSDPILSLAELDISRKLEKGNSESNSLKNVDINEKVKENFKGIGFQASANTQRLVDFIAYCLNPNHYHFFVKQLFDEGISKFMHKVSLGYTNYFNLKNDRSGALFQGKFKAVKIDSEEHFLWVTAYVNGNAQIHGLIPDASQYKWCSYPEYLGLTESAICQKEIILNQYNDLEKFKKASEDCFRQMKEKKDLQKYIFD
jgi:putative transposase